MHFEKESLNKNAILKERKIKTSQISPVALAFIGDSVHTLFVRSSIVKQKELIINHYNAYASKLCSAIYQAEVFDNIKTILTEQEQDIARRGRNFKTKSVAKGASIEQYKKSTAFEAVIGFLYLEEQEERLEQILQLSLNKGQMLQEELEDNAVLNNCEKQEDNLDINEGINIEINVDKQEDNSN